MNKILLGFLLGVSLISLFGTSQNAAAQNIIFENGPPVPFNQQQVTICSFQNDIICADDFTFVNPETITDFHFWIIENPSFDDEVFYTIYNDDNGSPGTPVNGGSGQGIIQDVSPFNIGGICPQICFEVWIDLPIAVNLSPGTYWIGVNGNGNDSWLIVTSDEPGNAAWTNDGGVNWNFFASQELPFALSGPMLVAGEIIPIETTSLILASAQSPAVWLVSTLSVLGIGAFIITRNPANVRNIKVILQDYFDRL